MFIQTSEDHFANCELHFQSLLAWQYPGANVKKEEVSEGIWYTVLDQRVWTYILKGRGFRTTETLEAGSLMGREYVTGWRPLVSPAEQGSESNLAKIRLLQTTP